MLAGTACATGERRCAAPLTPPRPRSLPQVGMRERDDAFTMRLV